MLHSGFLPSLYLISFQCTHSSSSIGAFLWDADIHRQAVLDCPTWPAWSLYTYSCYSQVDTRSTWPTSWNISFAFSKAVCKIEWCAGDAYKWQADNFCLWPKSMSYLSAHLGVIPDELRTLGGADHMMKKLDIVTICMCFGDILQSLHHHLRLALAHKGWLDPFVYYMPLYLAIAGSQIHFEAQSSSNAASAGLPVDNYCKRMSVWFTIWWRKTSQSKLSTTTYTTVDLTSEMP